MRRRRLLRGGSAGLTGLLAGCTVLGRNGSEGSSHVSVAGSSDQPAVPVSYDVSVVEQAASDHPPRLAVTIENEANSDLVLGEERAVQFRKAASDGGALYLLSAADGPTERATGEGCWRLTEGVPFWTYYGTVEVPGGESLLSELFVYGHHDLPSGTCLPDGQHRFRVEFATGEDTRDVFAADPSATWGFTLRVE